MHLDGRLIYAKHITSKRKQLNQKAKQMHWLLGRSTLSVESKLSLYKVVLKYMLTCGIQLWGQPPIPTSISSIALNIRLFDPF
jgi:hypothetical protein